MKKRLLILLSVMLVASMAYSQRTKRAKAITTAFADEIVQRYTDSLAQLKAYYDSTWTYSGNDLLKNPYYYRLFLKPTFYYTPISQTMDNIWVGKYGKERRLFRSGQLEGDFQLKRDSAMNDMLAKFYISNPQYIAQDEKRLTETSGLRSDINEKIETQVSLADKVKPKAPEEVVEPVQIVNRRPNFWTLKHSYGVNLQQFHFSDNWYKGGNNYNSFLGTANYNLTYNDQRKLVFVTTFAVKLGMQTVKGDTIHEWTPTSNEMRMVNNLNIKAIGHWSYSMQLSSVTQILPKYNMNSHTAISDIFSPFNTNLSVGMDYNLNKKFTLKVHLGALAFDYRYVARANLETRHGLKPNHHYKEYYGSNITVNYSMKIMKELNWNSRFDYFTDYSFYRWEFENTFRFTINKYLNTTLYLYPRFDYSRRDKEGKRRVEFQEYFSLGFNIDF
jgi:hypothetical protein